MARLVACADGNFTAAATWAVCDANSISDSEASATNLSIADQNSSTFTPGAVAIDAILIKFSTRSAGTPTNTITATLRNNTTATDITSVTVNVSELNQCDSIERQGGWYLFKFASTHTPNGTDTYLIKLKMSATTTTVAAWVTATTNWSRMLRTTTTQAPAAGDLLIVAKEMAAGSSTTRTVTMNNNTTTQFGTTSGLSVNNVVNAGFCVGNGGTVTWTTSAATNLRMAGCTVVYSGGTWNQGTSGSPVSRSFTSVLEFVETTNGDSGLWISSGATVNIHGESRTSGKNFSWTLLNADAASGQATLNVADDTGWLSGDKIGIAPTTQTPSQGEQKILNANAGASSMVATVNLTNTHLGTNGNVAEVVLLTRNVKIQSTGASSTACAFVRVGSAAIFATKWVEHYNLGIGTTERTGFYFGTITGTFSMQHCSIWQYENSLAVGLSCTVTGGADNYTIDNVVLYREGSSTGNNMTLGITGQTTSNWSVTNCVIARGANGIGVEIFSMRGTFTGNRIAGCGGNVGLYWHDAQQYGSSGNTLGTIHSNHVHSGSFALSGVFMTPVLDDVTLGAPGVPFVTIWRNAGSSGAGVWIEGVANTSMWRSVTLYGIKAWGNQISNLNFGVGFYHGVTFRECDFAGDTSFASTYGYTQSTVSVVHECRWENCTFGFATGTKTTHSTADMRGDQAIMERHVLVDTLLASSTRISTGSNTPLGSFWAESKKDNVATAHQTLFAKRGTRSRETTTVHAPETTSEKLAPSTAGFRLHSSSRRIAIVSGATLTVSVWVLKDAFYGETVTPCILVKANPALGIDDDIVLDTLGAAVINVWTLLSGTTVAVTGNGVLEFVVEAHGSAGAVFVGQWTVG